MPDTANSAKPKILSVALIVPDAKRREVLVTALSGSQLSVGEEFNTYPPPDALPDFAKAGCDVVIVDLGDEVERAITAIENICSHDTAMTVMAYSCVNDPTLMRRSMQAGAREFLVEPLLPKAIAEAFARTSSRQPVKTKAQGKLLVFVPSKGGVGLTTIATNFALALTKESGSKVVVVDLDFQLGEIALGLGMTASFSVVDALMNIPRLDKDFLSTLLLKHSSGLAVLSSPEDYNFFHTPVEDGAIKLFKILRDEFDYVVVDTGTCHGNIQQTLFGTADKLYLITEMTFPSLRNGHRLLAFLSSRDWSRNLDVVLNRFNSRHGDIDERSATKALGRPINWRIPNGYAAARAAEDSGVPLAMGDCPITRVLVLMARTACGKPLSPEKKASHGFSFFGSKALPEAMKA
jgi:pilus assembly protein CpaE